MSTDLRYREETEQRFTPPPSIQDPEQRQVAISYARLAVEMVSRFGRSDAIENALLDLEKSRNHIIGALKTKRELEKEERERFTTQS